MSLDQILRDGVSILNTETKSLQVEVQHFAWIGQDTFGEESFEDSPVIINAIEESLNRMVHLSDGRVEFVMSKLIVLEPVNPNGAEGRVEPVDLKDKLVLPNGRTGPIVDIPKSVIDPTTCRSFHLEIMIGRP
jgi:hypothetical protein